MKKMLMRFADNLLSKEQMKGVKGGGQYRCWCSGAMSNCFTADDKNVAGSRCATHGGENCNVGAC